MRRVILLTFCSFLLFCKNSKSAPHYNSEVINDTIKPKQLNKKSPCYANSLKFKKKYGFIISDFYDISEEIVFDIDNDQKKDTIAIISPLTLTPASDCEIISNELTDNRVLIILLSNGKKYFFDNVITNKLGVGTLGAEFIKENNNGFILEKEIGQSCFFKYEIQIRFLNNKFIIENITLKTGGCPESKEKIKVIDFKKEKFFLEKYDRKVVDSLRDSFIIESER